MATVILSAAGSAAGGAVGGSVLGISAGTLGRAAGAIAGSLIDNAILGQGSAPVETGRAKALRLQTSTEGAPIPRVSGRMRVSGQVIWQTRFRENVRTTTSGGKGVSSGSRQTVKEYSYSVSCAVGLCEGPIERIGRIWADGTLLDTSGLVLRIYNGDNEQQPDPKIQAVEGAANVPAYRGLAYAVFDDLPIGPYGNRIPQLNFEVFRNVANLTGGEEAGTPVPELVRAVNLSPGTGEFALDPQPARKLFPAGGGQFLNINNASGVPDMKAALDQLEADLPVCDAVSMVVSWFGNDLRCGHCRVEPKIEEPGRVTSPEAWAVSGVTANSASAVSLDADGRPNFGGTPSDGSIIRAIQELSSRDKAVTLYPFLLMDIPAGNGLPDPYGANEQPAFPWRGRITLDAAPGQPSSADQTAAASAEVAAFFGSASASDFAVSAGTVSYTGPIDWGWRRFVLHIAALGAAAGGIDSICIGTELRGLSTIRSSKTDFPAVDELISLAAEVRLLLPGARITYAADWSEYFGYQPGDGSGDVLFHLDSLWADSNIDAVGIDDYTPLSDWRHETGHADAEEKSVYSLPYLKSQVEGGEHYDWFYASDEDRLAQVRTPITDGAYGEPWVFRPKDIRNWWANAHYNRIDGVREETPTAWVPRSKPVWLTETGCPAVDLGANKPNLFFDEKSSESGLPFGSRGARDDEMQRRFLQAKLGYWKSGTNNPVSSIYGGAMIPEDRVYVWTWDARPWPDFPVRESLWADGPSHRLGHWVTGRVTAGALSEVVAEICLASGLTSLDFDVSRLFGVVDGYLIDKTSTGREALQPLMQAFAFDAFESNGKIVFATRQTARSAPLDPAWMVESEDEGRGPLERQKGRLTASADAVRLNYQQSENDYRLGAAEARLPGGDQIGISESSLSLALPGSRAQMIADRWLAESLRAQDQARFSLPLSMIGFEPGDVVQISGAGQIEQYRVDRISDTSVREVEAVRIEPSLYIPNAAAERQLEPEAASPPGPLDVIILDLPIADGSDADHQPRLAVSADPWPGNVAVMKSGDGESYDLVETVTLPALIGTSNGTLQAGAVGRWQRVDWPVLMSSGTLSSAGRLSVLNGANRLALEHESGVWEILQFQDAVLTADDSYLLGTLLRGQRGTEHLVRTEVPAGARIVVMDQALTPLPIANDEIGLTRDWKIGPARYDLSHPSYVSISAAHEGLGLRPFAPAHLKAQRAGADHVLSWVRTTRIGGDSLQAVEVPLVEETEAYRVTVRLNGEILRQADVSNPRFEYTAAMANTDGATGTIEFSVRQLSSTFGFGPERVIEINV